MKYRKLLLGALVTASALVLTACVPGSSDIDDQPSVLRVANPAPIASLDPFGSNSANVPTLTVTQSVFESLVTRQGEEFLPALAKNWENPDELTWDFTLEEGIEFADGTALTADDVKASLDGLIEAAGPLVSLWAAVDSVEAVSDSQLRIHTTAPMGTMLSNLALLPIAPSEKISDDSFFSAPFGSGPFKVESFTPSELVVLVPNENYRGDAPALDEIQFQYIPEVSSRVTALQNNEIDAAWGLPADQLGQFDGDSNLDVVTYPTYRSYYIWFNSAREPFDDERVRQAMWHAVDMEAIHKALFTSSDTIAKNPIPSDVFGSAPQAPYEYNPEKAKSLLADAGYPDGFGTEIMWAIGCCTAGDSFVEAMISDWAKVGISVEPQRIETAAWLERLIPLDWDMTINLGSTITGDADFTLARLYLSSANRMGYSNAELDGLLLQARQELDQSKRASLYAQAGEIIWSEAVGIFPFDMSSNIVLRSTIEGFEPTPNDMPNFANVTLK